MPFYAPLRLREIKQPAQVTPLVGRQVHLPPPPPLAPEGKAASTPLGGGAFINPEGCELGWINIYRAFLALPTAVRG